MKWVVLFLSLVAFPALAAQTNPLGHSHNSKDPIAIDSNTLEVLQDQNKAIFRVNVIAVQGDMTLKSDEMIVYYRQKDNAEGAQKPAKPATPAAGPDMQNSVSRIDVNGHVFITSPEETAAGDNGIYDVDKHMIFLTGNVVLTKGKNVLKGASGEYNVETGRSLLVGAGGSTPAPGAPPAGRVRGLFIPNQDDKAGKKP